MSWLDIVIAVCIVAGIVKGFFDGIVKQLISLIALVLAVLLSGSLAVWLRKFVDTHFPTGDSLSPGIASALYYIAAFMIILTLVILLARLVNKLINYTPAEAMNRILGSLSGAFLWMISLSILFNVLAVFDTNSRVISHEAQTKSKYYGIVCGALPVVYPHIRDFFKN
ncbi:MAG: CvpA family protein [Candidatus Symbiothrix sp.]|jgi:membrane protein required for colicin V production|nr:CvpA family protein [Candidatus Symbiothrix sp.]